MSPSAAMDASSLDRPLSSTEEAQLAEALELRRKLIDREIAEFTAEKENEFRKFEKRLRSDKRDSERQKILQCEREVDKANQKRRRPGDQLTAHAKSQSNRGRKREDGDHRGRVDGVRSLEAEEIPTGLATGQPNLDGAQSKKQGISESQGSLHEREREFEGLFTPDYLPLLKGQDQNIQQDSAEAILPERRTPSQLEQPALQSQSSPVSRNKSNTLATPGTLSPSDPRKMFMAERRSSSKSDISASSLRSSLRDPKSVRSSKKVLFSIDNALVSPSTSPVMQRKSNVTRNKADTRDHEDAVPQPVATTPSKSQTNDTSPVWQRQPNSKSGRATLTNTPTAVNNTSANGASKLQHPAALIWSTSPSMGGDDFEHIRGEEDEDLFGFDDGEISSSYRDKEAADEEEIDEEIGDEELQAGKDQLPTNSPHAGSLPIEIKWPGRRDPRG
ncbi:MAG: hypothetical protein Q9174_001325 [Haloplaca sp. 1 TL-2023]